MYLIDTSIWIDYLREKNNSLIIFFQKLLDQGTPFGITSLIYQEILQGANSKTDFNQLAEYLGTQRFFHPKDAVFSYQEAARLFFLCRRKGLTIRSVIDCLIAQIAIEHDLTLLHNDKDYRNIKLVVPELKLI